MPDQLGGLEGTLHERLATRDLSRKIRPLAMHEVKTGTKGGPHDDISDYRRTGDFGVSVFHRAGWFYQSEASSLIRVRGGGIPSVASPGLSSKAFDRIGFVVEKIQHWEKEKDDSEDCSGNDPGSPNVRLGGNGPGRTLAGNQRPRNRFLYEGLERNGDQPTRNGCRRIPPKLPLSLPPALSASKRMCTRPRARSCLQFRAVFSDFIPMFSPASAPSSSIP